MLKPVSNLNYNERISGMENGDIPEEMSAVNDSVSSTAKQVNPVDSECLSSTSVAGVDRFGDIEIPENVEQNKLITKEMIEQETTLENELSEQEKEMQSMAENAKKEEKENCYKRLQHLLKKSSIYANFLAAKISVQEKKNERRKELQEKQRLKQNSNSESVSKPEIRTSQRKRNHEEEVPEQSAKTHRPHKKAKKKENVLISDLFKKEYLENHLAEQDDDEQEEKKENINTVSKTVDDEQILDRHPKLFTGGVMRDYQLDGFEWLKSMFESCVNGILGDEMGLGKTIQSIALIAHFIEKRLPGPYLVCGPLSTLPNWVSEFQRFCPKIPVMLYHGSKDERHEMRKKLLKKVPVGDRFVYPIVITSYTIIMFDQKLLSSIHWKYIIIDEAHRIKNFRCRLFKDLQCYSSGNLLLLTGTPLQNNLAELWALLHFVLPEVFNDLRVFESWFDITLLSKREADDEIISQEQEKHVISTIHQILAPFFLRRTKADVLLKLPPKKEVIVYAPLSPLQEKYYSAVVNKTIESVVQKKKNESNEIIFSEGRSRRKRKQMNYAEIDNNGNESDDDDDVLKVGDETIGCEFDDSKNGSILSKLQDEPTTSSSHEIEAYSFFNGVTMTSALTMMRKICMHPYLISCPLDSADRVLLDEDFVNHSGKLKVLDLMLPELKKRGHKVLLFSQFVQMLELLEDYCVYRNYNYKLLHGSINLKDRQEQIEEFNENEDAFLFLISTRAGGLGINLASADTVIIYDSDWNPQCDLQAQDRCHRIGQTKPVIVYRLIIENTIDEKMVERATAKRKLEKMIMQEGRFSDVQSKNKWDKVLTRDELLEVLLSTNIKNSVKSKSGAWLSKEELEMLLDRSALVSDSAEGSQKDEYPKPSEKRPFKVISEN